MSRQMTLNERINLRGNLERYAFGQPLIRVRPKQLINLCYQLAGQTPSRVVGSLWPRQPRKYCQ